MPADENKIKLQGILDLYEEEYPSYISEDSEWRKILWVAGQEIKNAKYLHALYVDSYGILDKKLAISDKYKSVYSGNSESTAKIDIVNLVSSFFPETEKFNNIQELQLDWITKFTESITPNGFKNLITLVSAKYLIERDIDAYLNISNSSCPITDRIEHVKNHISVFVYEWSSTDSVFVGGYYFTPGSLPFMSVSILIGFSRNILTNINTSDFTKYFLEYFKKLKSTKVTPTLSIHNILITEKWSEND